MPQWGQTGADGTERLASLSCGRPFRFAADRVAVVVAWVIKKSPRSFGFLRSRWRREALSLLMLTTHDVKVSREAVRRWLRSGGLAFRRPRPVVGPEDPERQVKLEALRRLPDDEKAVFQDEVDVNTNPEIGPMWMKKGQRATVETPGDNEKRCLSGSIHCRTGQVLVTPRAPKQGRARRRP